MKELVVLSGKGGMAGKTSLTAALASIVKRGRAV